VVTLPSPRDRAAAQGRHRLPRVGDRLAHPRRERPGGRRVVDRPGHDEAAVELIKQGATDYVLKDRPARLPAAIQRALAEAGERARLARLEAQLLRAQRLASLGQLAAAQEAVSLTRQMLAVARREITGDRDSPSAPAGPPGSR
jgi:DNA-binding NarL/FixJ family response regulator